MGPRYWRPTSFWAEDVDVMTGLRDGVLPERMWKKKHCKDIGENTWEKTIYQISINWFSFFWQGYLLEWKLGIFFLHSKSSKSSIPQKDILKQDAWGPRSKLMSWNKPLVSVGGGMSSWKKPRVHGPYCLRLGQSALTWATEYGLEEILQLLLRASPDVQQVL